MSLAVEGAGKPTRCLPAEGVDIGGCFPPRNHHPVYGTGRYPGARIERNGRRLGSSVYMVNSNTYVFAVLFEMAHRFGDELRAVV